MAAAVPDASAEMLKALSDKLQAVREQIRRNGEEVPSSICSQFDAELNPLFNAVFSHIPANRLKVRTFVIAFCLCITPQGILSSIEGSEQKEMLVTLAKFFVKVLHSALKLEDPLILTAPVIRDFLQTLAIATQYKRQQDALLSRSGTPVVTIMEDVNIP